MGYKFIDQYSILHTATGILAYFWNMSIITYIIINISFEIIENTGFGVKFINKYLGGIWPGGKNHSDNIINRIGDITFGTIGWLIAYYLDHQMINKQIEKN